MPGFATSAPEVTNVSRHGFWLLLGDEELLVRFSDFPWFPCTGRNWMWISLSARSARRQTFPWYPARPRTTELAGTRNPTGTPRKIKAPPSRK
jgi:hypothetical protein